MIAKIFYERECSNKEDPIYDFDEIPRNRTKLEGVF